jgi:PAS domain S-box-containing protein
MKLGEIRWVLDAGVPRFESDGTFDGYIGSCIDITDQKRVEEALRQSEVRLRFLLESTHATPWVADAQTWRFTYIGPQAAMLLGYPTAAWFEDNFWPEHIHPDDREQAVAFCVEHSWRDTNYQFEYRMKAADGRILWIHDIVNVVRQGGAPTTLHGFMIDVTALRSAEEESRNLRDQLARAGRVQTLGQLAASIAHEVNQPLCAIVSNAQTLRRMLAAGGYDTEELQEALQDIMQDGQRGSAVIDRLRPGGLAGRFGEFGVRGWACWNSQPPSLYTIPYGSRCTALRHFHSLDAHLSRSKDTHAAARRRPYATRRER